MSNFQIPRLGNSGRLLPFPTSIGTIGRLDTQPFQMFRGFLFPRPPSFPSAARLSPRPLGESGGIGLACPGVLADPVHEAAAELGGGRDGRLTPRKTRCQPIFAGESAAGDLDQGASGQVPPSSTYFDVAS